METLLTMGAVLVIGFIVVQTVSVLCLWLDMLTSVSGRIVPIFMAITMFMMMGLIWMKDFTGLCDQYPMANKILLIFIIILAVQLIILLPSYIKYLTGHNR